MSKHVILGTAGHIDHGKSSLVKALTGIDPDRLKEEKERGITIDLGFANLTYPDGLVVGIVDVPGHEKLIKNMLAGAGGIDILLMVIAADEGIMPQSREHLAICDMLKIKTGLIALTKIDTVEPEWAELMKEEIRDFVKGTFLDGAEIVGVSSKTGQGLEGLKEAIRKRALQVQPKMVNSVFRLPIDRVFTLKGFGTVVTGTALSGEAVVDMAVEILPAGITSKIRGLQSHGKATNRAYAGQRVGINLQGVEKQQLKRGDCVVSPKRFRPTKVIDCSLEMLKDAPILKNRSLVHLYLGTAETTARVILYDRQELKPSEQCYCQFRLESEVIALSGDRYIIRRFSPLETIGGGTVLDPIPERRKKTEGLQDLEVFDKGSLQDKIEQKIRKSSLQGLSLNFIEGWIFGDLSEIKSALKDLVDAKKLSHHNELYFHSSLINLARQQLKSLLNQFHIDNPLKPGMTKEELRTKTVASLKMPMSDTAFELLLKDQELAIEKDTIRLSSFKPALGQLRGDVKERILAILNKEGFQPPTKKELQQKLGIEDNDFNDILKLMTKEGSLVKINDTIYITRSQLNELIDQLKKAFSKKPELTVAEIRDILNTSRKYALPLMEYLDSQKITLRVGDIRRLLLR